MEGLAFFGVPARHCAGYQPWSKDHISFHLTFSVVFLGSDGWAGYLLQGGQVKSVVHVELAGRCEAVGSDLAKMIQSRDTFNQ